MLATTVQVSVLIFLCDNRYCSYSKLLINDAELIERLKNGLVILTRSGDMDSDLFQVDGIAVHPLDGDVSAVEDPATVVAVVAAGVNLHDAEVAVIATRKSNSY